MTLQQYYDLLNSHDWFYEFSDDQRAWSLGNKNDQKLKEISGESEDHRRLYISFVNHHFSGGAWNTEKSLKPTRPK